MAMNGPFLNHACLPVVLTAAAGDVVLQRANEDLILSAALHASSYLLSGVAGSGAGRRGGLLRRNIHVPGFGDAEFTPYRRPAASDVHRARQVTCNVNQQRIES